jgi:hypothetical protein
MSEKEREDRALCGKHPNGIFTIPILELSV